MFKLYCSALALVLAGVSGTAYAQTTWFVDAAACPAPGSGTLADPFCSIQAGINAAINGDEIVVAAGTYLEAIDLLGKAIILRSADGPDVTTIDATGQNTSTVTIRNGEGEDTVLEGFGITGGTGQFFLGWSAAGGGLFLDDTAPTVNNCTFFDLTAQVGAGAWVGDFGFPAPTFFNCRFIGNTATSAGGAVLSRTPNTQFNNCVFSGNTADRGGAIFSGAPLHVCNSVFHGNTATDSGSVWWGSSQSTLTNSIVWGNGFSIWGVGAPARTYSLGAGGLASDGNIGADPMWVDAANGDFHLLPGSPCVNRADPDLVLPFEFDLDGEPRLQQCRVDIGVDETDFLNDCNTNGIADACDLVAGTSFDCNADFIPDECEDDCNGNGLDDSCDIASGTSTDFNANLIPDQCDSFAYNLTQVTFHGTIAEAIAAAVNGDDLFASPVLFTVEPNIDFAGKSIVLSSFAEVGQPAGGVILMADNAALASAANAAITLGGDLQVPFGALADILTSQLTVEPTGALTVQPGAGVLIEAEGGINNTGSMSVFGVLDTAAGLHNQVTGTMTISGFVFADVTNDNQATFNGDSYVIGDYLNNGTTDIKNGTLTIFGTLTNNGTINGNVSGGAAAGPGDDFGLAVSGDLVLGPSASLLMPSPELSVRVEGNYDVAIDDSSRYDMAQAELRMVGAGDVAQQLEVMSTDLGSCPGGLDRTLPGRYPIGTLRIGPTPTIVNMADIHDNDGLGQTDCEAIYVQNLIIEAGATLNTNTCKAYYGSLTLDGSVDDLQNLIQIEAVPGDFNGDCRANLADHAAFSDCLNGPNVPPNPTPPTTPQQCLDAFDFNGDLDVDLSDFAELTLVLIGS